MCFVVCSMCEDKHVLDAFSANDSLMYKAVQSERTFML